MRTQRADAATNGGRPACCRLHRRPASLPTTVTDVAHAAGTEPRALEAGFRRDLDTTPTAYPHRVGLDGAHRDLQAGDPTRGDTVAAVAARWGFSHPGRFAVEYARAYRCSPSETLHS